MFISAPENVAWLLNIRGSDNPNSPIPNCRLIIGKNKELFFISEKLKTFNLVKERKINKVNIYHSVTYTETPLEFISTSNFLCKGGKALWEQSRRSHVRQETPIGISIFLSLTFKFSV